MQFGVSKLITFVQSTAVNILPVWHTHTPNYSACFRCFLLEPIALCPGLFLSFPFPLHFRSLPSLALAHPHSTAVTTTVQDKETVRCGKNPVCAFCHCLVVGCNFATILPHMCQKTAVQSCRTKKKNHHNTTPEKNQQASLSRSLFVSSRCLYLTGTEERTHTLAPTLAHWHTSTLLRLFLHLLCFSLLAWWGWAMQKWSGDSHTFP